MQSLDIKGKVVTAASGDEYTKAIYRNSDLAILQAPYVVFPTAYTDIPAVLAYAASQTPPLEVAVKGGGAHPSAWASTESGVVIDLARLNKVVVAEDKKSVTVQGGAVWGDVYEAVKEAEVEVVGALVWFVGVGGYTVGGGYSPLSGIHGLAIDNLLGATVVLADGRIVKTSASEEPDLFWAIRGGANQFGIVVEFTFKAHPSAGPYTVGNLIYPGSELANVVKVIQQWSKTTTVKEKVVLGFVRIPPLFEPAVVIMPFISSSTPDRAATVLAPFLNIPSLVANMTVTVPDMLTVSHGSDAMIASAPRRFNMRGALFAELWEDMVLGTWERWEKFTKDEDVKESMVVIDLLHLERLAQVGQDETAANARLPHFISVIHGRTNKSSSDAAVEAFVSSTASYMQDMNTQKTGKNLGVYINNARGDEKIEDVFGPNLPRLRKLKAKYDPKKVWGKGFVIEPDFN